MIRINDLDRCDRERVASLSVSSVKTELRREHRPDITNARWGKGAGFPWGQLISEFNTPHQNCLKDQIHRSIFIGWKKKKDCSFGICLSDNAHRCTTTLKCRVPTQNA